MTSGRRWTKDELEYLEENWGNKNFIIMSKELNRTITAIKGKGGQLGLGSTKDAQGLITQKQLAEICNVDWHVVKRWIDIKGLKAKKKATSTTFKYWFIDINDFWKFAEKNKEIINFSKIEKGVLLPEPDWVEFEKKRSIKNIKQTSKWSKIDEQRLIHMFYEKSYEEIAEILQRSISAIEHKAWRLQKQGKLYPKKIQLNWSEKELQMLFDLEKEGKSDTEIAWELGREKSHIIDKRRNLRGKGLYIGTKSRKIQKVG